MQWVELHHFFKNARVRIKAVKRRFGIGRKENVTIGRTGEGHSKAIRFTIERPVAFFQIEFQEGVTDAGINFPFERAHHRIDIAVGDLGIRIPILIGFSGFSINHQQGTTHSGAHLVVCYSDN